MNTRRSLTTLFAMTAVGVLVAVPNALATVRHVHPGGSIQRAINHSRPGDTIVVDAGTYRENLDVATNDLRVVGAGSGEHGTVLRPGSAVTPSPCTAAIGGVSGFCVHGNPSGPGQLRGFRLSGFRIVGFAGDGVATAKASDVDLSHVALAGNGGDGLFVGFGGQRISISHVRSWKNGFGLGGGFGVHMFQENRVTVSWSHAWKNNGYGISGFVLHKVRYLHNVVNDNGAIGFYVGDSPNADALVRWNTSFRNNEFGFFFRDSSHGVARDNLSWGNCTGIAAIDIGENPAPTVGWTLKHNRVVRNNAACPASEDGPALSGIGILLLGTQDAKVVDNVARGNHPTGPSMFAGGISLFSSLALGGADPTGNRIARNTAEHNRPFDIRWDGSGSNNSFPANDCDRSSPLWICS